MSNLPVHASSPTQAIARPAPTRESIMAVRKKKSACCLPRIDRFASVPAFNLHVSMNAHGRAWTRNAHQPPSLRKSGIASVLSRDRSRTFNGLVRYRSFPCLGAIGGRVG